MRSYPSNNTGRKLLAAIVTLFAMHSANAVPVKGGAIDWPDTLVPALIIIAGVLLIVILVMGEMVIAGARIRLQREKDEKENEEKSGGSPSVGKVILLLATSLFALPAFSQEAATPAPAATINLSVYMLAAFILFELLLIIGLAYMIMFALRTTRETKEVAKKPTLVERLNASVSIEKESDILLDHNYDGIQELDNNLPPWWKYGFYVTIVFAVIYLVHFHVTGSGKLPHAEYLEQMETAKVQAEAYKKKAANLIDESNPPLLTDASSLAAAQKLFTANCAACHGPQGQGIVGPNLTDEYWLHNGGMKDIFRSIKSGWPEKGMKAWQGDFSGRQIQELASFIKSLKGSNPANPKEKQGELWTEEVVADSAAKDSLKGAQ